LADANSTFQLLNERAWGTATGLAGVEVTGDSTLFYTADPFLYAPSVLGCFYDVAIGALHFTYADLPIQNLPYGAVFEAEYAALPPP
jgi:hypothetical protein